MNTHGRRLSLLRNTSWSAAGNIATAAGRIAITVILARRLGPDSFGAFVFVQWLIDMTFLVFSVGLTGTATRFFSQFSGTGEEQLRGFNRWYLLTGAMAVALSSCFAALACAAFTDLKSMAELSVITLWASTSSIWALLGARAQGLFHFKKFAVSSGVFVVVALVGLSQTWPENDLRGAMIVFSIANFAGAVCCVMGVSGKTPVRGNHVNIAFDSNIVRSYATNSWLTSIVASLVWARGELPLVKRYLGESAVGFYSVGLTLSGIINQGIGVLTGALWPQISRAWDNGDRTELARFCAAATNLLILVAGILTGFVICFAPSIVTLLFGDRYDSSSQLVLILAVGALGLTSGCAHLVLQAATNGEFARNITIGGGIALLVIAFIAIPVVGIEGAAATRSAVQILMAALVFKWIGKLFGQSAGIRHNSRAFFLLILLAASLAIMRGFGPALRIWQLCVLFGTYCGLVFLICLSGWESGFLREVRRLSRFGNA